MNKGKGLNPIFIIGVPRSGTTLLRVLLDSHSWIAAAPETPWIVGGYGVNSLREIAVYLTEDQLGPVKNLAGEDENVVLQGIRAMIQTIFAPYLKERGKDVLVLKTPDDIRYIDFLLQLYPESKYIHIYRDGRDVACSTVDKKGFFFGENLRCYGQLNHENALRRWYDWETKVRGMFKGPGLSCLRISYEELVMRPEETMKIVCETIGVAFEKGMLDYTSFAHEYPEWEAGSTDAKKKTCIDKSSIGRWKINIDKDTLLRIEARYGDFLAELGYELSTSPEERAKASVGLDVLGPTPETDGVVDAVGAESQDVNRLHRLLKERNEQIKKKDEHLNQALEEKRHSAEQLRDVSKQLTAKHEQLIEKDTQLQEAYGRLKERNEQIRKLNDQLNERDSQLRQAHEWLKERNDKVAELKEAMEQKHTQIAQKDEQLASQANLVAQLREQTARDRETLIKLEQRVKYHDERFRKKCEELIEVDNKFKVKCVEVVSKDEALMRLCEERSGELQRFEEEEKKLKEEVRRRDEHIAELLNSMSWKITAPLRGVYGIFKRHGK